MSSLNSVVENVNDQIEVFIAFLQEQIDFHKKMSERFAGDINPYRSAKHKETAADFRDLRDFILSLEKNTQNVNRPTSRPLLTLSPEDIEGLPEEQIEHLSITSSDKAEFSILAMLEASGGIMSLDQIIVGLYRETEEIQKRNLVTARLYRMAQKGMIHSVPTKKGVYSLEKITEEEAEAIFKGGSMKVKSN